MWRSLLAIAICSAHIGWAQAQEHKTYSERESWVTRYLDEGGKLENITGLVLPDPAKKTYRANSTALEIQKNLPKSFDWREKSEIQPVRNQGNCGSCWAFAITGVIESLAAIKRGGENVDLAEQTLVSTCESGGDCNGGYFDAFDYVKEKGLPLETDDPYTQRNSRCKPGLKSVQSAIHWSFIGEDYGGRQPSVDELKTAIYRYGPIAVGINGNLGSYSDGVYNSCGAQTLNHMVILTGWTDDDKYKANGGGYWHMKNSWGESWGMDGYMNIVYKGKNGKPCNGVAQVAAFAVIEQH